MIRKEYLLKRCPEVKVILDTMSCACKHKFEEVNLLKTSDNTSNKCSVLNTLTATSYPRFLLPSNFVSYNQSKIK